METPHVVMKFTIILFGKFEMFNLVSNLRIGLTQFGSPNLFNCLVIFDFAQIIMKCIRGTSWTNM